MKSDRSVASWTPHLESLEERTVLAFVRFSGPFFIANVLSGVATITVRNDSPVSGETPQVELITSDGTAKAGVDYQPVDQVITFPANETTASVAIPLMANASNGPDKTIKLSLRDVSNPKSASTAPAVVYLSPSGDLTSPTVSRVRFITNHQTISGIMLTFSKPMQPGPVEDIQNYFLYKDLGHAIGAREGPLIPLTSAVYDSRTQTVTLTPAAALPAKALYRITFNIYDSSGAVPSPIVDLSGIPLSRLGDDSIWSAFRNPRLDGFFGADFARGRTLSVTGVKYHFGTDRFVPVATGTLKVTGGGTMELISSDYGTSAELRIVRPTRRTVLTGSVAGLATEPLIMLKVVCPIPIKVRLNPRVFPVRS